MIHGVHVDVILAGLYALFLVGVAMALEFLARHSHRRSEQYRNSGFVYKRTLDVWECPTGHHLKRTGTDLERRIARYRAEAHVCNTCHCKPDCTDANDGRQLVSRPNAWLESELRRFHQGISLTLLLLAVLILAAEMMWHREARDWLFLTVLLVPIGFFGSRHLVSFLKPRRKDRLQP